MPKTYTVPPPPHHNEGKTVAGWTMSLGIVAGSTVFCAGMVLADMAVLLWVGAAIVALAIVVSIALSLAGLGQPRGRSHEAAHAAHAPAVAPQPAEADAR
ncbi:HGxxPAAW family protein [Brachybacterium sp. YJGR34]|uniref:HGxxPAAW family protein n=1 Tax=Brachybacterium sp. YJGR34 TaxID=2059911 RepID=UPI000E0A7D25|nr:HGxxPAAW family protein [Brachybacterium sp. YJGR34]